MVALSFSVSTLVSFVTMASLSPVVVFAAMTRTVFWFLGSVIWQVKNSFIKYSKYIVFKHKNPTALLCMSPDNDRNTREVEGHKGGLVFVA